MLGHHLQWNATNNIPFCLPKNTQSFVIPHSITVCFTIGCGSVKRCETVWCNISCSALNSASYLIAGSSWVAFNCVWSRKYTAVSAISATNEENLVTICIDILLNRFCILPTFRAYAILTTTELSVASGAIRYEEKQEK